jgi:hypothetical protein
MHRTLVYEKWLENRQELVDSLEAVMKVKHFSIFSSLVFLGAWATGAEASNVNDPQFARLCKISQDHIGYKTTIIQTPACKPYLSAALTSARSTHASSAPVEALKAPPAPVAAPSPNPCNPGLIVRADPTDIGFAAILPSASPAGSAKGASISYTNDQAKGTQSVATDGIVSYVVFGGPCGTPVSGGQLLWAMAPWVSSSGTWNEPIKKGENEALKGGVSLQVGLLTPGSIVEGQYLVLSPFDQTDFRGTAHAAGVNIAYEPVISRIYMGQSPGPIVDGLLNFYWELRPEAEFRQVTSAGVTNLTVGNYDWFGGTLRAHWFLFPDYIQPHPGLSDWPAEIANRFSIIATAQYFSNAISSTSSTSSTDVRKYSAAFQYKLTCPKGNKGSDSEGSDSSSDSKCHNSDPASTSISFEYDWGVDKDTLVFAKQYLIKLNVAY